MIPANLPGGGRNQLRFPITAPAALVLLREDKRRRHIPGAWLDTPSSCAEMYKAPGKFCGISLWFSCDFDVLNYCLQYKKPTSLLKQNKNLLRIKMNHFSQCSQALVGACHVFSDDRNTQGD